MAKTRSHHRRKHHKKHGGDASNYVESVVGPYPHSAQGGSNVIAQHVPVPVTGGSALSPGLVNAALPAGAPPAYNVQVTTPGAAASGAVALTGGKKNKGGNVLSELAVPAVLLIANQKFGKRKSYKGKKSGYKGKRFSSRRRRNRF